MQEATIINGFKSLEQRFQQIVQFIQNFTQSVRLDSTGKEIRLLALQQLLIKKGTITEAEMTEQSGEVIKEMQKQAEEEAKKQAEAAKAPAIVTPTPEQVQQVTSAPASDAAVKETVAPPQA
jgi:hypothetical protein